MGFRKSRKGQRQRGKLLNFPGGRGAVPPGAGAHSKARAEEPAADISHGIIAGAADLDPAAVLTATVAGASFGLSIGWVVLMCIPILKNVFDVAARIGQQTRQGLVELVRQHYGIKVALALAILIVLVNGTMIAADLLAVSDAFSLVLRQPKSLFPAAVGFTVWYLLSSAGYHRAVRTLGWFSMFLLAYVLAAALATSSFSELLKGILLPRIPATPAYAIAVVAIFGSLLTPDILVWQTSARRDAAQAGAPMHGTQAAVGCAVASIVSLSAIVAASNLRVADPTAMTTRTAAEALASLGTFGPVVFSIGIIGSGLIALPILVASLCFSIAEAVNWRSGLNTPPWQARRFYLLICALLLIAVVVSYSGINTVKILYGSQILAGVLVVPLLIFIFALSNNPSVVRERNTRGQNFWLGGAIGGMIAANAVFLYTLLRAI